METENIKNDKLQAKDFATEQDVRWCPGCGDYSILKQMQTVAAELQFERENTVFVSGIGCSSRFPYYMNTYGMHSIHGRATAVASGLKASRPDLNVWIITGDGDALSIGGNHLIHLLRRNFDLNILMFNNEIYGLTKGQYSPTSPSGKITKSTPMGSIDHPFNPLTLVMGAGASFVARSLDRDPVHMREIIKRAQSHKGTSFVEVYQNCNVFNDGAFFTFTEKETKGDSVLFLEHGKPLIFGANSTKGIKLDGFTPTIVSLDENASLDDLWIHNENDKIKANILSGFFENPSIAANMPRPFGVFYSEKKDCYEDLMMAQIDYAIEKKGKGDLNKLLSGAHIWEVA